MTDRNGSKFVGVVDAALVILGVSLLSACGPPPPPPPAAHLSHTIIWKQADGKADDAETPPPERTYNADGARAVDNQSMAGSHVIKWDAVGGYVHAVPGDNPNENEDAAMAISRSKVQTELVVSRAGNFTFEATVMLDGLEIIGAASVDVSHMVVVQNSRGVPIPNGSVQEAYRTTNDANGDLQVTTPAGSATGGTLTGDQYADAATVGVALTPGRYWIQMELNLTATASTSFPAPAPKPEGHLDTATLTLSVR